MSPRARNAAVFLAPFLIASASVLHLRAGNVEASDLSVALFRALAGVAVSGAVFGLADGWIGRRPSPCLFDHL